MEKICVWADYTWYFLSEVEPYLAHHSDDYMTIEVPEGVEDIDQWLHETKPQG